MFQYLPLTHFNIRTSLISIQNTKRIEQPFIISMLTFCFAKKKLYQTRYQQDFCSEQMRIANCNVREWGGEEEHPATCDCLVVFYCPWVFHKQAFVFRWRTSKKCNNYKMIFAAGLPPRTCSKDYFLIVGISYSLDFTATSCS